MEHIEQEDNVFWEMDQIVPHQGPLDSCDCSYKGSEYNVTIQWKNGEQSDEPLTVIGTDAPIPCAIYAEQNNLLDKPGWKRFKKIAKIQSKLIFDSNKAKIKSQFFKPKHKHGIEVPRHYNDAVRLDKQNGDTLWADAVVKEMECL